MNLATLSKHPYVYSNHHDITVYEIICLIISRSTTCASLFGSTMSNLVDLITRDGLDTT